MSFPDATGYSVRNLKYMAKFALRFPEKEIVQAALAQITWYHHIALMDKVKNADEHIWYAEQVAKNGWSRNVLVHQIESGLYQRQVLAEKVSNFESRLPSPQSELAVQTMKDPYIFDFIPFKEDMIRSLSCQARGSGSSAAHCWLTMISLQRTKTLSGVMMTPGTACSSSTRRERTVSLLTRRGTTTPGTVPLSPMPAAC